MRITEFLASFAAGATLKVKRVTTRNADPSGERKMPMSSADTPTIFELKDGWQVAEYKGGESVAPPVVADGDWIGATVPSVVHYDLMRVGRLSNPYASVAAVKAAAWVPLSDWVFRTAFSIEPGMVGHKPVFLEFDGVDTFADIWLNGRLVFKTADAFRSYRIPLKAADLRDGSNDLVVHVKAHDRMIQDLIPEAREKLKGTFGRKGVTRRYQRSYFGNTSQINLNGEVLAIGLYRPVRVVIGPDLPIETVNFQVHTVSPGVATATLDVTLAPHAATNEIRVVVSMIDPETNEVAATATAICAPAAETVRLDLSVSQPRLWWPRGYGRPDLYDLVIELFDGERRVGMRSQQVGLKRVEVVEVLESGRPTFRFRVNGTDIHVRGFNIMPLEYLRVYGAAERYDMLLRLACEAHGSLIRIWGGGAVESDSFYDSCDRLGIMIWHDFFLHSSTYPEYDEAWVAAFRDESESLVRRLRNHAALTVWCGGNEQMEGWDEWGWRGRVDRHYGETLLTDVLPDIVRRLSPSIPYIVNSPHGGSSAQSPLHGDTHCWGNFYNSTKDPLFVTETCWNVQSYSRPETLRIAMDLDLAEFEEIGWPEKWKERTNLPIFPRPPYTGGPIRVASLRDYLVGQEIEHAWADYHALSMLRLRSPSCVGIIYWPLNKGAPLFDFGCVDFFGYPLANYYSVKRLFADVALGIYRDIDDIRVVASNLGQNEVAAKLEIVHVAADGSVLHAWDPEAVTLTAGRNVRLGNIDGYYGKIVDRAGELIRARIVGGGEVIAEDTLFFCPLSDFQVQPDALRASATKAGDGWLLELKASSVVKLAMIEGNQKYLLSDNYFPLVPGQDRRVHVALLEVMTPGAPVITVSGLGTSDAITLTLP
jgi:beta-mannosidase